jgi:hypothetical protein
MLYQVCRGWTGFELTLVVTGIYYTASWKANYHTITTTTASFFKCGIGLIVQYGIGLIVQYGISLIVQYQCLNFLFIILDLVAIFFWKQIYTQINVKDTVYVIV